MGLFRSTFARLIVSVLLLGALISSFGGTGLAQRILSCDLRFFAVASVVMTAGYFLNALRWRMLLASVLPQPPPSLLDLFALILAGMFCNFFMPSTLGGDIIRAEIARKHLAGRRHAYVSILMDRILGMLALVTLGFTANALSYLVFGQTSWQSLAVALGIVGFFGLALVVLQSDKLIRLIAWVRWAPLIRISSEVQSTVHAYLASRSTTRAVFILAILANITQVIVVLILAKGMAIEVPAIAHFVAVPLIVLVTLVPVTLNGLGVREGTFAYFYGTAGVPASDAIALSLVFMATTIVPALFGGLVMLLPRYAVFSRR
jgi:glycosyltransferase 2 family protein